MANVVRSLGVVSCLVILVVTGCAMLRSGKAPLALVDTTVGVRSTQSHETSTDVGGNMAVGGDSTGGSVIGGGGDSVALWVAILCLAAQPVTAVAGALLYQHMLRPRRIRKENGTNAH